MYWDFINSPYIIRKYIFIMTVALPGYGNLASLDSDTENWSVNGIYLKIQVNLAHLENCEAVSAQVHVNDKLTRKTLRFRDIGGSGIEWKERCGLI